MLVPIKDYPALLHTQKQRKTLIIADLHLGWEVNLAQKGIYVPSQTQKILQKLLQLVNITKPNTLIILGDVKHTIAKAEPGEWRDIPEFFEAIKTKINDIQIVRGNHDGNLEPLLPQTTQLHPSTGIVLDAAGIFHGHTWPATRLLLCKTLVMGHVHPTVVFRDSLGFQIAIPAWIKAKFDIKRLTKTYLSKNSRKAKVITNAQKNRMEFKVEQLIILPCFNSFLGGKPINKKNRRRSYIGPVLRSGAVDINKAEAYLLDGTLLGTIERLKTLS